MCPTERQRPPKTIRDKSPCDGCTERFTACQDRCPKDERGEHGIKAYHKLVEKVNAARAAYLKQKNIRY